VVALSKLGDACGVQGTFEIDAGPDPMAMKKKTASPSTPAAGLSLGPEIFREAMEAAPNAMIVVEADGTMAWANPAAERLFDYESGELVGQSVELLVPPGLKRTHRRSRFRFADDPENRPMGNLRDLRAVTRDGSQIPVEIGLSPIDTPTGFVVICAIIDLTARKRAERNLAEAGELLARKNEKLLALVATDGLTSLRSRRAFMEDLTTQLEVSVRHARPLSVLILDIDHFKLYNDSFGHLAGDEVLKQVGRILLKIARRSDFVARLGGEEFGIILPETDKAGAGVLGERFRRAIERADWPNRSVTASLGATTVEFGQAVPRPKSPEISVILGEADRALYRSKETGRNRVTHVADMGVEV
jgi:diguanylate cyclase (GGDEF)-like protein/PAS domain S-box-containing protein